VSKPWLISLSLLITIILTGCFSDKTDLAFEADVQGQAFTYDLSKGYFHLFVRDSSTDLLMFNSTGEVFENYEVEMYLISLTEDTLIFHPDFEAPQTYKDMTEDMVYHGNDIEVAVKEDFVSLLQNKSEPQNLLAFNPVYTAEEIHIHPMTLKNVRNLHGTEKGKVSISIMSKEQGPSHISIVNRELRLVIDTLRQSRELDLSVRNYSIRDTFLHDSYLSIEELDFSSEPTYLFVTGQEEAKTSGEIDEVIQWLQEFSEENQD